MSPRLTVWRNTRRPVCERGIGFQRNRLIRAAREGDIDLRDINREPDALARYGADVNDVRRRLHCVDAEGRLHAGAPCAAEIWRLAPGGEWFARLIDFARLPARNLRL
jgi:predicted DCC family thiol-disulfide oxidoreductase YuxK